MKKIIILIAAVVLLLPVSSFATYVAPTAGQVTLGSTNAVNVGVSNGVLLEYVSNSTDGQSYVLGAYHKGGDRSFGSSSVDTNIYYKDGTANAIPSTAPASTATGAGYGTAGWTAL